MTVFIVGDMNVEPWAVQGLFTSEARAVEACKNENYFVGPAVVDEPYPDDTIEWPGLYYPHRRWINE